MLATAHSKIKEEPQISYQENNAKAKRKIVSEASKNFVSYKYDHLKNRLLNI